MRLLILSDLHFEFLADNGKSFMGRLWPGHDACVIAGDLCSYKGLADSLKRCCDAFKKVIYVTGNHEYYGATFEEVHDVVGNVKAKNFTWLNNQTMELDGKVIYGGTMWFNEHFNPMIRFGMNDFSQIKNTDLIFENHNKFVTGLWEQKKVDIVISHHLPAEGSIAPQFKGDMMNHFFMHDMEKFINERKPSHWIHGHTHTTCDYDMGDTRVICNPMGYPMEPGHYTWKPVVVDV